MMRGGFARLSTACLLNKRSPSKNTMHTVASTDVDGILIYGLFSAIRRNVIAANSSSVCVFYLLCLAAAAGLLCVSSARDGERPKGSPLSLLALSVLSLCASTELNHVVFGRRRRQLGRWCKTTKCGCNLFHIPYSTTSCPRVEYQSSSLRGLVLCAIYFIRTELTFCSRRTQLNIFGRHSRPKFIRGIQTRGHIISPTVLSVSMVKVIGTVLSPLLLLCTIPGRRRCWWAPTTTFARYSPNWSISRSGKQQSSQPPRVHHSAKVNLNVLIWLVAGLVVDGGL